MLVDLHIHSTSSDGTLSPSEIAQKTKNFEAAALTDHDTINGVKEFLSAKIGPKNRIAGTELSLIPGEGYDKFHLLGLGIDIKNSRLHDFFHKIVEGRNKRNIKILENLRCAGIKISDEQLARFAKGNIIARPHIANALVELKLAKTVKEAFKVYLVPGSVGYAHRYRPSPKEAFDVIHAAGGLAIMAHPKYWTKDPAKLYKGLQELKSIGLDGIEAHYQANSLDETMEHLRIAKSLNLFISSGSDFHGTNKPDVHLGMDTGEGDIKPLLFALTSQ